MASFTDTQGRKWNPRVMVDTITAWERAYNFSFLEAGSKPAELQKHLYCSVDRVVGVLFHAVKAQAKELGVSEEAFAAAMDGAVLRDAGEALKDAIRDFWPVPEPSRPSPDGPGGGPTSGESPGPSESIPAH